MSKVISVQQKKGGVGKTTLSINLAYAYHQQGKSVLLVDQNTEQQHAVSFAEMAELDALCIEPAQIPRMIPKLRNQYDVIIIDGHPAADLASAEAIKQSDLVIIPVQPKVMDIWDAGDTAELVKKWQATHGVQGVFVVNGAKPRSAMLRDTIKQLEEMGLPIMRTVIGDREDFARVFISAKGVSALPDSNKAGFELRQLMKELNGVLYGDTK